MSSVRAVPETELMSGEQLSADDAWHTVRRYGLGHLLATGFLRFRYGDGFSHARAFALQLALATVPLIIAGAGLAAALGAESFAEVVARTVVALSPGSSDALVPQVVEGGSDEGSERGEVVVALGLATAFLAATSAFAQLERGANRIYGTDRDRPALRKYARAALLTADRRLRAGGRPAADRGGRAVRGRGRAGLPLGRRRRERRSTSSAGRSGWPRSSSR